MPHKCKLARDVILLLGQDQWLKRFKTLIYVVVWFKQSVGLCATYCYFH